MENLRRKRQIVISNMRQAIRQISPIVRKNRDKIHRITSLNLNPIENCQYNPEKQEINQQILADLSLFDEKYELKQKIGQGSDGVVYKCFRKKDNKVFAVKTMMMDDEQLYFLNNNFKIIKKLHHKFIVKYQALYIDICKHKCYLVMEYLPYPSLAQLLPFKQENEVKALIYQLFEALQYLHKENICHRDIKPQNIILNQEQNLIKIVDFGISNLTCKRGHKKPLLTITGTLFYRAPQMFHGGGYNEAIDIWAAGITLYKLLIGKTPFQSTYHSQTIHNILSHQINWEHKDHKHVSQSYKDLVQKLLSERQKRVTSKQAKEHHWFQNILKNKQQILKIEIFSEDGEGSPVVFVANEKKELPMYAYSPMPKKFEESQLVLQLFQLQTHISEDS